MSEIGENLFAPWRLSPETSLRATARPCFQRARSSVLARARPISAPRLVSFRPRARTLAGSARI